MEGQTPMKENWPYIIVSVIIVIAFAYWYRCILKDDGGGDDNKPKFPPTNSPE